MCILLVSPILPIWRVSVIYNKIHVFLRIRLYYSVLFVLLRSEIHFLCMPTDIYMLFQILHFFSVSLSSRGKLIQKNIEEIFLQTYINIQSVLSFLPLARVFVSAHCV